MRSGARGKGWGSNSSWLASGFVEGKQKVWEHRMGSRAQLRGILEGSDAWEKKSPRCGQLWGREHVRGYRDQLLCVASQLGWRRRVKDNEGEGCCCCYCCYCRENNGNASGVEDGRGDISGDGGWDGDENVERQVVRMYAGAVGMLRPRWSHMNDHGVHT
eukprot:273753-Chlamydomonas_euryale.AAC.1